ncbi:MAG TPA: TIGR03668 family PPOX class F420-dependent oxidoreductase [Solirubrobacteraceae bacterium]|nr:TIGR03668 family PPOX class F420-dependent oxidoreductase [Solirubrobacteraceae bacterium]
MDAAAARRRFAEARVARLATITPDGRPHLVPIVFALAGDTVYSAVDAKPKRSRALARLANVAAHPVASVLADHYEEDWSALWWARGDGRARVLEPDLAEAREAITRLRRRYPEQRVTGAVLAVDVERWSGWAAAVSR